MSVVTYRDLTIRVGHAHKLGHTITHLKDVMARGRIESDDQSMLNDVVSLLMALQRAEHAPPPRVVPFVPVGS